MPRPEQRLKTDSLQRITFVKFKFPVLIGGVPREKFLSDMSQEYEAFLLPGAVILKSKEPHKFNSLLFPFDRIEYATLDLG